MIFKGICRKFSLKDEGQYNTIGAFWDEMAEKYGLEKLRGLGFNWSGGSMLYAIGLKDGDIPDYNFKIALPGDSWESADGETKRLKELYDEIYRGGALEFEIETFYENGKCNVLYRRKKTK
jgi:hypothetical protein